MDLTRSVRSRACRVAGDAGRCILFSGHGPTNRPCPSVSETQVELRGTARTPVDLRAVVEVADEALRQKSSMTTLGTLPNRFRSRSPLQLPPSRGHAEVVAP